MEEIAELLWAAQGVTEPSGLRTAPSAGALYPLEVYLVTGEVSSLDPGIYRYAPNQHALTKAGESERRADLAVAALGQGRRERAPGRSRRRRPWPGPGRRCGRGSGPGSDLDSQQVWRQYASTRDTWHIEVGHAAQNVYLQAVALGLGTTEVGAFDDCAVKSVLGLADHHDPLAMMPIGHSPTA